MHFGRGLFLGLNRVKMLGLSGLTLVATGCLAQSFHLDSAGARFGFYPFGAGGDFHQVEGFVYWDLPWDWDLGSLWRLQSRVDASLGWLEDSEANAAVGGAGPSLVLGRQHFPLTLEVGVSPTVVSRADFITKDFGDLFQFTSHIGLNVDVTSHIRLSYRFQHMSNAGLNQHNPGLNLNMLGVSYIF